ncbi:DUF2336 domain-containing protein [Peteryoungia ipomoeae]|uniref:DUF2336 domain-containing protein n=2 Tax=Peteryoungia ipomoeae TaxID=1210932 RepID=A0A4S8P029_9HYPH|nr:DUF2336 domain-containing protein [Peteryoungia ipomoeae]
MATVTSFQALSHPGKSELRQFAELFQPLFAASSIEARRDAVAALSQSPNLPLSVAAFIASQPISIAAPFLAVSPALSDDMLIIIARCQGADHARAIVKREKLSPMVIDALVSLRHYQAPRRAEAEEVAEISEPQTTAPAPETPAVRRMAIAGPETEVAPLEAAEQDRIEREESLRRTIKTLALKDSPAETDRLGRLTIGPVQAALLVRFARAHDGGAFCTTLADVLSSSRWLAERILIDISGRQLATTLVGCGMELADAVFVLAKLYPHLGRSEEGKMRAERLLAEIQPLAAESRIESWLRADRYTYGETAVSVPGSDVTAPATTGASLQTGFAKLTGQAGTSPATRRPVGDDHARQVLRARKR